MTYYVYILQCADGTFYTGVTNNIEKRIARHNAGHGARYTRGRLPVRLAYFEELNDIKVAMSREAGIRRLSRMDKRRLIDGFGNT